MSGEIEIDFDKMGGLAPAIIQDEKTGEILMLGFLNAESLKMTLASGFVTFYSRTRQALWTKGETSGNRLQVISASTDCDQDAVLFKVRVLGDGLVCHEGTRSCFTRLLSISASPVSASPASTTTAPAAGAGSPQISDTGDTR
jgi:phosphoribosyl-ATP pyrophosphohydrolase/phosphoribosyl-AMP cyclohydrolase